MLKALDFYRENYKYSMHKRLLHVAVSTQPEKDIVKKYWDKAKIFVNIFRNIIFHHIYENLDLLDFLQTATKSLKVHITTHGFKYSFMVELGFAAINEHLKPCVVIILDFLLLF